jgi:prepilin-type processing-associated H-X9-DG protein
MMLPALSQAREKARRISCASNLKSIGLAIRMYSQENKEQFPDKNGAEGLEMLRAGGYLENVKMYTCPSTATISKDGEKLTEANVSYVYMGGHSESSPPDTVIMYDKPNNHVKYRNILYADGHVAGSNWMDNIKK